jgi:uncharacterized protein
MSTHARRSSSASARARAASNGSPSDLRLLGLQPVPADASEVMTGDVPGYFDRMTSDVTVTYFGSHRFSRTFRGRGDIMENFVPPLLERLEGPIKITSGT